jgi:hypothetical protein
VPNPVDFTNKDEVPDVPVKSRLPAVNVRGALAVLLIVPPVLIETAPLPAFMLVRFMAVAENGGAIGIR